VILKCAVIACILLLTGCSSAISRYISSQQSFGYEQIASREILREQGFYESEFCSQKTDLCISYLTAKPLSHKQKLSYRVELQINGRNELNQLEIKRESTNSCSGLVVLIHGFRASKEYMVNSALYFRFLGFDVLLPDLLGHGESSSGIRFGVDDSKVINELIEELDHPGERILIVGNSLGAVAATQLIELRGDIGGLVLQAPMIRFDQAAVNYIDAYSPFLSSWIPKASIESGAGKALTHAGVKLEQTDIIPLLARNEIPTLILVSNDDPVAPPEIYKEISNEYISVAEVSERSHPSMAVITQQDDEIVQGWLVGKANKALQKGCSTCSLFCSVASLAYLREKAH
jgi:pimeloyl-ACP methyl ester carboxylesterase